MQDKARLKRIATFLFGVALVSLGLLFIIAPERDYLLQTLIRYWPVFLILAGLVRLGGHLIDREPRSPLGAVLLATLGGILLTANLRGESNLLEIFGRYWFFLLLALIVGRVLGQYTSQPVEATGKRRRAFGPGTLIVMMLMTGGGLLAHRLSHDREQLARFRLPVSLSHVREIFGARAKSEERISQSFAFVPGASLQFQGLAGDLEVRAGAIAEPRAVLIKSAHGATEEEARASLQKLRLEISSQGRDTVFNLAADDPGIEYQATIVVELPAGIQANVEANGILGQVTIVNLFGIHRVRDAGDVTVAGSTGGLTIENPRGNVALERIQGPVVLKGARREARLADLSGEMTLELAGGLARIERVSGAVRIAARQTRVELRDINNARPAPGGIEPDAAGVEMRGMTDCRLTLASINSSVSIEGERTRIEASEIAGDLTIRSSSERIRAGRVTGRVRIAAENGSVEVTDLAGAAEIEATREVKARNFSGPFVARTRLGAITLELERSPEANVEAESQHGSIRVQLPEEAEFGLEAATSFGRLRVRGFERFGFSRRTRSTSVSYQPEALSPVLNLRSTNGDITLAASGESLASRSAERR